MKKLLNIRLLFILLITLCVISCDSIRNNPEYLLLFHDTILNEYGYKDPKGNIVIPAGKYSLTFTDTFRAYAIVLENNNAFIAIDRQENELYKVFSFDNGPDIPSEGLFRIMKENKIGFADAERGTIIINPIYDCAYPFVNGKAKVTLSGCRTVAEDEYVTWENDSWFYIDKKGRKIK